MVTRFIKRKSRKTGMSPGTMVHVGERKVDQVTIAVIDYDTENIDSMVLPTIEKAFPFKDSLTITWLNITGLHDVKLLEKLGKKYQIHPLVLEDILNTDQRPKVEIFENYIFVVLKMLSFDTQKQEIEHEQISLIVGNNYVITFQEREGDVLNPIRERLKNPLGRLRKNGADYLAYTIIDVIVDHYFILLEKLGEKIETLEENVIEKPNQSSVKELQLLKRELIFLRRSVWPLRELISGLSRDETTLISSYTSPYLRDVYDHTIQVIDTVETFRDMVSGILDIYLSSLSNKMNEVMKVLTIIATIFIPLSFIAGVYGMNFEFMPELKWPWGYPTVWGIMLTALVSMLIYFKRKKWF
ncbi:MAG: magnesium/cobalt transporter CorA [bacterium]|nr:MAG: magnesium/cobalt transporter CorA [bacterium]